MNHKLELVQSQKLAMTQQMRQAIKILQLSIHELNDYIEDQIVGNPLLEMPEGRSDQRPTASFNEAQPAPEQEQQGTDRDVADGYSSGDYTANAHDADSPVDHSILSDNYDKHEYEAKQNYEYDVQQHYYDFRDQPLNYIEQIPLEDRTLNSHLITQLGELRIANAEHRIARFIVGALDRAGYLTLTVEEIASSLKESTEHVEVVLRLVQSLDPIGVAARDLKECLLIQIDALSDDDEVFRLPRKIIEGYLMDLAENRIAGITRALKISTAEAQRACDFIKSLEPKPGRGFGGQEETKYIIPDVFVERLNGQYLVSVSEKSAPKLKIYKYYENYLSDKSIDKEISKYINDQLKSAQWLIRSIDQRRKTIRRVVEAIIKYQSAFFQTGRNLNYLTLKQVAEDLGIHESTVSRAVNDKYLQYESKVFELRFFFDSGVSEKAEGSISSKSVRAMIVEMISNEDCTKPLNDQNIADTLKERGIKISRRTVAKYRTMLELPPSDKRRRYCAEQ